MLSLKELSVQEPLVILDLANNHNGSVEHAKGIIQSLASVPERQAHRVAIKFQYRDLDTFVHPDFQDRYDLHYVKRFLTTRLSWDQFAELTEFAHGLGFLTAATPFDEASVQWVEAHGHDFLKVASASITDWPLWEAVAQTQLPIVASTAGAALPDVDRVASFLSHRDRDFALMHCVAAYPTRDEDLLMDRIDLLRHRYPDVPIGFSTHEDPDNDLAGPIALAKGCVLLERHVGQGSDENPLNAYSSEPEVVGAWLTRLSAAARMCGGVDRLQRVNEAEIEALNGLRRGVFLRNEWEAGADISGDDVFFAIPLGEGQITANDWSKYLHVQSSGRLAAKGPLLWSDVTVSDRNAEVQGFVDQVTDFLTQSGVTYPENAEMELSHHRGLGRFQEVGMTMITVVNREYCKKLLIMLPGQEHPEQWHEIKEETFHVLHGSLTLWLDGVPSDLAPGDVVVVERGVRHRFASSDGCVIEEISTRHEGSDSFYVDPDIAANLNRKTFVRYWGNV
jgi:sialic acid synthase SpsE/quercetin dioxygenase-like cupin family protein